jgi:hypothetical protein
MKTPNDSIEQSRLVLLQTRRWAQRGLELLANADEAEIIDQEEVATIAEALQTIVRVTEPAQIRKMKTDAQMLALSDLVELLLSEDFRNHIN